MIKKFISTSIIIVFLFTITGCSNNKQNIINETTTQYVSEITTQLAPEITTYFQIAEQTTINHIYETTTNVASEITLTDNQLIEMYKNAATKTHSSAKSVQKISMKDFQIENGGAINSIMKMFLPVISKVVENNSTEFDGITGGYSSLTIDDVSDISYTKTGDNINIKMQLKEQVDSGSSDINSGTVGHAISVIGDLSSVFSQLKDSGIPISVENENIEMTYKNAKVDVTIDNQGNIITGLWCYDVTLDLNNFTVGGTVVPKACVIISNEISVN